MSKGNLRHAFLVTASVAAILLMVERGALAENALPATGGRWWFSGEGQYQMQGGDSANYSADPAFPLLHPGMPAFPLYLKPKSGLGGGIELGFQPGGSPYSFAGRVRFGKSKSSSGSDSTSFPYGTCTPGGCYYFYSRGSGNAATHRESHLLADLEIGRDVGLGSLGDTRVLAGLRFAKLSGTGSFASSSFERAYSDNSLAAVKRSFTGIGPLIGFDSSVPLAEQLFFDVGASGALLFGKQSARANGTFIRYYYPGTISVSRSKSVVVPNLEASAALSYLLSPSAKISVGYRADAYFNALDTGNLKTANTASEGDRIIHGPFAKFTLEFGGK